MKSKHVTIALFCLSFLIISSCTTSKYTATDSLDLISKIVLEKVSMGGNSQLGITKGEILQTEMQRGGTSDAVKGATSENDWNKINRLVSAFDLSQMNQWEAPTNAMAYDGARATTIIIESNGKTYNSQSFDEGKPPAELKELYDYLESLVNQ